MHVRAPDDVAGLAVHQKDCALAARERIHCGLREISCLVLLILLLWFRAVQFVQLLLEAGSYAIGKNGVGPLRIGHHLQNRAAGEADGEELIETAGHWQQVDCFDIVEIRTASGQDAKARRERQQQPLHKSMIQPVVTGYSNEAAEVFQEVFATLLESIDSI